MVRIFSDVWEWIRECQALPRQDLDNVMLFSGPEGVGKSTLMYQIGKALDPQGFGLSRIGFSIEDYIEKSRQVGKNPGAVVASDEFLANRRKAMQKQTILLLDFLQECRGLNQHHIICFPHADLLDRAVIDYRIRWHVHIPRRGLFQVKEKVKFFAPGGIEQVAWRVVGAWYFAPCKGAEWDAYKAAKEAHMTKRAKGGPALEGEENSLWDLAQIAAFPARYDEACRKILSELPNPHRSQVPEA